VLDDPDASDLAPATGTIVPVDVGPADILDPARVATDPPAPATTLVWSSFDPSQPDDLEGLDLLSHPAPSALLAPAP